MITEDYVSFEIAKLLKEKGFDCECYGYYDTNHGQISLEHSGSDMDSNDGPDCYISAPTLQMAIKWLREIYKLHIEVNPGSGLDHRVIGWGSEVLDLSILEYTEEYDYFTKLYPTYEEAAEAAIKYCLKKLI